jgi:hypothetical protein
MSAAARVKLASFCRRATFHCNWSRNLCLRRVTFKGRMDRLLDKKPIKIRLSCPYRVVTRFISVQEGLLNACRLHFWSLQLLDLRGLPRDIGCLYNKPVSIVAARLYGPKLPCAGLLVILVGRRRFYHFLR